MREAIATTHLPLFSPLSFLYLQFYFYPSIHKCQLSLLPGGSQLALKWEGPERGLRLSEFKINAETRVKDPQVSIKLSLLFRGFLNTVEEDFLFLFVLNYVNFSIAAADVNEACMGIHGYRDWAPL